MLDIHTHLFWESYNGDRDQVVQRAREAGIDFLLSVGTSFEDNPAALKIAEQYPDIFASVGLHPHMFSVDDTSLLKHTEWIEMLRNLARHEKVRAIGECGLDYFSRPDILGDKDLKRPVTEIQKKHQRAGLLSQLALAKELRLPLILHTRPSAGTQDAYEDMFEILRSHFSPAASSLLPSILHCYQGDLRMTEWFLTLPRVFFSFTGSITYPVPGARRGTGDDPTVVLRRIPLDRLFVETDSPFLAPQPRRGERNEPAFVRWVAASLCQARGISMTVLETALTENAATVFGQKTHAILKA